jgi:carotenoid cleavage dioxygenase-like enzyme
MNAPSWPPPLPDFLGFTTVEKELSVDRLPTSGSMPDWLQGTLIRNGPARFDVGDYRLRHWFDGLAMLHAFSFRNGHVAYANKYLRTESHRHAVEQGRLYGKQFGPDPCTRLLGRYFAAYSPNVTDNANVNITRIADRFAALVESPIAIEFDPRTLETIGRFEFVDPVPAHIATPHPHRDIAHRALFNYGTLMGEESRYQVFTIPDGTARQRLVASIPANEPCYMHSFGMTEHYLILVEFPVVFDPVEYLEASKSIVECATWLPDRGTRFLVISKDDGTVKATHESESCFAFHHVNAFEQGAEILLDITATATPHETVLGLPPTADQLELDKRGYTLRRYRIPLTGGSANLAYDEVSDVGIELPRINYDRYNTRDYRYVYGLSQSPTSGALNRLRKIDLTGRESRVWHEKACFPGEPVFVPAPNAAREDDGVVLSAVLDARAGSSFLLVIDGASFAELARAQVPQHIPSDLHGQFYETVTPELS